MSAKTKLYAINKHLQRSTEFADQHPEWQVYTAGFPKCSMANWRITLVFRISWTSMPLRCS